MWDFNFGTEASGVKHTNWFYSWMEYISLRKGWLPLGDEECITYSGSFYQGNESDNRKK